MILSDLHTHSRYSDGKGKISQNAEAAKAKGLKQVGITDHGLRHIAYGMRQIDLPRARKEVDRLNQTLGGIEVLLGIEANIYASDGTIDLKPQHMGYFDYIVAGYHMTVFAKSLPDMFRYNLKGIFRKTINQSDIALFTKTFIAAIKSGKIDIISHPCYALPIDIKQVGQAAIDYGVLLELNGKKISMSDEEVLTLAQMGAKFIVNSDAHSPKRVGDFSVPLAVVERLGINTDQIVNWNNTVDFKK